MALETEVALDTVQLEADQHGQYALVREGVYPLKDGFVLVVHHEHEYAEDTELVLEVRGDFSSLTQWRKLDLETLKTTRPQRSW